LLIESTTHVGDIVLDCTASTGTVTEGLKKQRLDVIDAADDIDLEELPDAVIKPLNRYCK
jgi:hypothetical protein